MSDRNDRSDRLRRRLDDEPDETDADEAPDEDEDQSSTPSSKPSSSSKTAMPAETSDPGASVKDRPSVLMYLPEDLHQEMDIRFDEVNAAAKRELGEGLEKNRDWYPLLLSLALEKTEDMDDSELLTRLDDAEY